MSPAQVSFTVKAFKHIEAPKELDVEVLRALFELLGLSPGLAQLATQGSEEPVKQLQQAVGELVNRGLKATTDMPGRLAFWGQSLLRDEELRDWRTRLDALKTFTEALSPYNTVGKLKNLRIGLEDITAQKQNLEVLSAVRGPAGAGRRAGSHGRVSVTGRDRLTGRSPMDRAGPDRAGRDRRQAQRRPRWDP